MEWGVLRTRSEIGTAPLNRSTRNTMLDGSLLLLPPLLMTINVIMINSLTVEFIVIIYLILEFPVI